MDIFDKAIKRIRKPKKIQTNSLYGELRGKNNGKQK